MDHVRAGSEPAFEALFDRHHRGVLGFCRHMLGSVEEAEDAVQHTFLSAYRELVGSTREVHLRPWLYTIARNRCLTMLRGRRRMAAGEAHDPPTEHLAAAVERRVELRDLLSDVAGLPEDQRAALVLSELGDMSHDEIADVLGCRRDKVKALVFQARSSLIASRTARETPCADIREQLANLHGGSLRRNELRRHVNECAGCREFRDQVRAQRRDLALVLPVAPTVGLKSGVLGGAAAGSGAAVASGGAGAGVLAAKVLVVAAIAGGGTVAVEREISNPPAAPVPARAPAVNEQPASGTIAPSSVKHVAPPAIVAPGTRGNRGAEKRDRVVPPGQARKIDRDGARGKGHARGQVELNPGHGGSPPGLVEPKTGGNGPKVRESPALRDNNGSPAGENSKPTTTPKPLKAVKPVKPVKPTKAPKPAKATKPTKLREPVEAATPGKAMQPDSTPAEPSKPTKPVTPAQPAKSGNRPQPATPADPDTPVGSARPE